MQLPATTEHYKGVDPGSTQCRYRAKRDKERYIERGIGQGPKTQRNFILPKFSRTSTARIVDVRTKNRSLGNGVHKNGVRNRCPYRRCGVDTEIPYRLPFWREFCWVFFCQSVWLQGSILNFRIGSVSSIGGLIATTLCADTVSDSKKIGGFSCGPGDGEKLFDTWASGHKGQECPQEIRAKMFMLMLFFFPDRKKEKTGSGCRESK